ncbi:MAG: hypothetical protein WC028_25130 [Candidatus Obscuribacterales bacterium]
MLCPHCSSPHHNLCAAGFRVEVDMTTLPQALSDFSTSALDHSKSHLLGSQSESNNSSDAKPSILVVLPVFSDTGLGTYGSALLAARAPEVLKDGKLTIPDFQGSSAQTHLIDLLGTPAKEATAASDDQTREPTVHVLLVGLGNRSSVETKVMCAVVGSALDGAVSGLHNHLVIAVSDFSSAPNSGQQIAALTRCRLTVALVEEQAALVLSRLTLIVESEQVPAICRGVAIAGPLCSSCSHPRTAIINLSRSPSKQ